MKLPKGDQALIDVRKLTDYVLCAEHDDGRHKAKLFRDILGIGLEHADDLISALRAAASSAEASPGRLDRYGQRYVVDFDLTGPRGTATVRSVWIVREESAGPELVTCYIL